MELHTSGWCGPHKRGGRPDSVCVSPWLLMRPRTPASLGVEANHFHASPCLLWGPEQGAVRALVLAVRDGRTSSDLLNEWGGGPEEARPVNRPVGRTGRPRVSSAGSRGSFLRSAWITSWDRSGIGTSLIRLSWWCGSTDIWEKGQCCLDRIQFESIQCSGIPLQHPLRPYPFPAKLPGSA